MTGPVAGALAAVLAGAGAYLLYTGTAAGPPRRRPGRRGWMQAAGLGQVRAGELAAATGLLFVLGAVGAYVLFGAVLPAVVAGCFSAGAPVSMYRRRRRGQLFSASEAWPRMLEELRLLTGSLGRSVPQALFEVGRRGPDEWRADFAAAEREWLLTTDFARTAALLKARLADPAADVVCETLVVAHEVGGSELDGRLAELIEDRILELQYRKDALSRQAGVRFARRFVLLVPLGMAAAGLTIGSGRAAYATPGGQAAVVVGLLAVVACWVWSGRLMRLPDEPRVFG